MRRKSSGRASSGREGASSRYAVATFTAIRSGSPQPAKSPQVDVVGGLLGVHARVEGHVDDRVAVGVGGADLEEAHGALADAQVEAALERLGRRAQLDVLEAERAEDAP